MDEEKVRDALLDSAKADEALISELTLVSAEFVAEEVKVAEAPAETARLDDEPVADVKG